MRNRGKPPLNVRPADWRAAQSAGHLLDLQLQAQSNTTQHSRPFKITSVITLDRLLARILVRCLLAQSYQDELSLAYAIARSEERRAS